MKLPALQTILILVLLCVGTGKSLMEADGREPNPNYWEEAENLEETLQAEVTKSGGNSKCLETNPNLLRKLANALLVNGKTVEAGKIYSLFWTLDSKVEPEKYNPIFVKDAIALAGVYQSQGSFKHSSDCFESVLSYEINRLEKTDSRVVRDANNLAVSLYLESNIQKDRRERNKLLERSRQVFLLATSISDDRKSPSLVSVIQSNRNFLKRDYVGARPVNR